MDERLASMGEDRLVAKAYVTGFAGLIKPGPTPTFHAGGKNGTSDCLAGQLSIMKVYCHTRKILHEHLCMSLNSGIQSYVGKNWVSLSLSLFRIFILMVIVIVRFIIIILMTVIIVGSITDLLN